MISYLKREFSPSVFTVKPNGSATFGVRSRIFTANGNGILILSGDQAGQAQRAEPGADTAEQVASRQRGKWVDVVHR